MFPISWIIDRDSASASSTYTALIHRATHLTLLEMSEYDPYLAISLFGHLFPGIAKNVFPVLTIFKMFLIAV